MDIKVTFDCSIFGSAEGMDVAASGHAYAANLESRVALEYPDASVSVEFNENTDGARSTYSAYDVDGDSLEAIQDHLFQLSREVFEDADFWVDEPTND